MKFSYLNFLVILVNLVKGSQTFCDVWSIGVIKQCFAKETLTTLRHNTNQMTVDTISNVLYFGLDLYGTGDSTPGILNIETKKLTVLKGVKDAFAMAADEKTGIIYFGGTYGIYRYNRTEKTLRRFYIQELDVWWLWLNKGLHFIRFPELRAYIYRNKKLIINSKLKNIVIHQFVIDKDDNVFFINNTGLFGLRRFATSPVLLETQPKFVGMAIDKLGNVYVCSEEGIFVVKKLVSRVKKVLPIQGVLSMVFDRDNHLIYSDSNQLVRLIPINIVAIF